MMGSDWIEHDGGDCPGIVFIASKVGLKFRNGKIRESVTDADLYVWDHTGHAGDIVAYRICENGGKPREESKPMNSTASSVPIPDGWRALHPDEMVKQFDVIWNAEKRRGTPVLAWGYQYKNATGVLIIRQLLSCYHRGCGSVDVGTDR